MEATQRYAAVTGANKGIGLEAVKQLGSNGITLVLTARYEKKGLEAVDKLKEFELSGQVLFHQLYVADPASVASLADFIKTPALHEKEKWSRDDKSIIAQLTGFGLHGLGIFSSGFDWSAIADFLGFGYIGLCHR
nr:(+)-neomenthol dehydrogenase-like [Ziziphus jujuba var. spinosa]